MRKITGRRKIRIVTEIDQDFKEQLEKIWIPF